MGNGCSFGNFRRRRHNAIAPRHSTKLHEIPIGDATAAATSTKSQFSFASKPRRLATTRSEFPKHITNSSDQSIVRLSSMRAAAAAAADAVNATTTTTPVPVAHTPNRISLINEHSILSDANDPAQLTAVEPAAMVRRKASLPPIVYVRSASVDSATTDESNRHDGIAAIDHDNNGISQVKNENGNLSKLYRHISGSVQSLFPTNAAFGKKRQLSASDTSLNVCGKPKNNRLLLSQQQLIDSNYCPSVLYSRKSRNATSDLNLGKGHTLHRWKNNLLLRFTRRKSDSSFGASKT